MQEFAEKRCVKERPDVSAPCYEQNTEVRTQGENKSDGTVFPFFHNLPKCQIASYYFRMAPHFIPHLKQVMWFLQILTGLYWGDALFYKEELQGQLPWPAESFCSIYNLCFALQWDYNRSVRCQQALMNILFHKAWVIPTTNALIHDKICHDTRKVTTGLSHLINVNFVFTPLC